MTDSRFDGMKDSIQSMWNNILHMIQRTRDLVPSLTDPNILVEQMKIIFRNESKENLIVKEACVRHIHDVTKFE